MTYCIIKQCVVPENIHTPTVEEIGNSRGLGGSQGWEISEGTRGRGWGGEQFNYFPDGQLGFGGTGTCCTKIELIICCRWIKVILAILYTIFLHLKQVFFPPKALLELTTALGETPWGLVDVSQGCVRHYSLPVFQEKWMHNVTSTFSLKNTGDQCTCFSCISLLWSSETGTRNSHSKLAFFLEIVSLLECQESNYGVTVLKPGNFPLFYIVLFIHMWFCYLLFCYFVILLFVIWLRICDHVHNEITDSEVFFLRPFKAIYTSYLEWKGMVIEVICKNILRSVILNLAEDMTIFWLKWVRFFILDATIDW